MHSEIGGRRIGDGNPLFVIAELGLNHGGSLSRAIEMVDRAATAGVSAVKLQTFRADGLVAANCPAPAHVPEASLRDFFRQFELDRAAHIAVRNRARLHGLAGLLQFGRRANRELRHGEASFTPGAWVVDRAEAPPAYSGWVADGRPTSGSGGLSLQHENVTVTAT